MADPALSGAALPSYPRHRFLRSSPDAYSAALSRDVQKINRRNEARQVFVELLRRVGAYVEFRAHGNVTMLASSGFELLSVADPRLVVVIAEQLPRLLPTEGERALTRQVLLALLSGTGRWASVTRG